MECDAKIQGEGVSEKIRLYTKFSAKSGSIVSLPFLHKHLKANMKHTGGFLPLLMAALAPVLGGVAGGLIEKGIAGSGIYSKKRKGRKRRSKKKKSGSGMYLNPWMGPRSGKY